MGAGTMEFISKGRGVSSQTGLHPHVTDVMLQLIYYRAHPLDRSMP